MIEAYFFTTIFNSLINFITATLTPLIFTLIEVALAGVLLKSGGESLIESLKNTCLHEIMVNG